MQNYLSEFNCNSSIGLKWRNWLLNRQNRQYNFVVKMVQGESRAKESKCFYCGCLYFGLPRHRVLDECYIAIRKPRTGAKAMISSAAIQSVWGWSGR